MKSEKPRWHKTFLGAKQQHTYWLYKIIDDVLMDNPQICRFVEIGTGQGALSVILGLHALQRNGHLITFDTNSRHRKVETIFNRLEVIYYKIDCFSSEAKDIMEGHIKGQPTLFFCDGDHKPEEFNTFVPMLPPGSIIAAHDYSVEIQDSDLEKAIREYSLEPLCPKEWKGGVDDIQTCFFLKP